MSPRTQAATVQKGPLTLSAIFNELLLNYNYNYNDLLNPNSSQTFSVYLEGTEKIIGKLLKL